MMDRRFGSKGQQGSTRLQYRTSDGDTELVVPIDSLWIELPDRDIIEIDLSPLESCIDLKLFRSSSNPIRSLDLSPLASCTELTHLDLGNTELQMIDLTPLAGCTMLTNLHLGSTELETLSLKPLQELRNLMSLSIKSPRLKRIDLTHLRGLPRLRHLVLGGTSVEGNNLEDIDLVPLSSCPDLETLEIGSNSLLKVDLTHLGSIELAGFRLEHTRLQELDLTPLSSHNMNKLIITNNQLQSVHLSSMPNLVRAQFNDNHLQHIDLSPLGSCNSLEFLFLSNNQLSSIDLTPLSSCHRLHSLRLDGNCFESIDLSPLTGCIELDDLRLHGNRLRDVDLGPLSSCSSLSHIWLGDNQLSEIDLTPLNLCEGLGNLFLDSNQLQTIDLSPLSSLVLRGLRLKGKQLERIDVTPLVLLSNMWGFEPDEGSVLTCSLDREVFVRYANGNLYREGESDRIRFEASSTSTWTSLYSLSKIQKLRFPLYVYQQTLLEVLDLSHFGLIDTDIREVFEKVSLTAEPEEVQKAVLSDLLQIVARQIDDGGTTIGLDLDALMKYGEIATRADKIAALRRDEMESVMIPLDRVNRIPQYRASLLPLWLTAYGFRMLDSLKMGSRCSEQDLTTVEELVSKTGFDLQVVEREVPPPSNISEGMRRYVSYLISAKRRN